ncbi:hypothetical protein GOD07_25945 [Sinorhizobium medicae]|nr:hypothetical protein [Sinorhizobium medicae]
MKANLARLRAAVALIGSLASTCGFANQATEIFECSVLAGWAGRPLDQYDIAIMGYNRALLEASDVLKRSSQVKRETPDFNAERTPDYWAGMWMGASNSAVQAWLQNQHPLEAREDAGTTERVTTVLRQQQVWKPIADREFHQRGCELYLRSPKRGD